MECTIMIYLEKKISCDFGFVIFNMPNFWDVTVSPPPRHRNLVLKIKNLLVLEQVGVLLVKIKLFLPRGLFLSMIAPQNLANRNAGSPGAFL
jgi:hypothetical protein